MLNTHKEKIKTIIVSRSFELYSTIAAHDRFSIIGYFESHMSLKHNPLLWEVELLLLEAVDASDPVLAIGEITAKHPSIVIIGLMNTYSEFASEGIANCNPTEQSSNFRIFMKPWNYMEILGHISEAINKNTCSSEPIKKIERTQGNQIKKIDGFKDDFIGQLRTDSIGTGQITEKPPEIAENSTGKVITIINSKGGVGKTFLAVNLACALAMDNCKVALVDTNLGSCDMALHLDLLNAPTITDLIPNLNDITQENIEENLPLYHKQPLRVLLGPNTPELCELVEANHMLQLIGLMKDRFDRIVVDTASCSFSTLTYDLLEQSDIIVVVTTCDLSALQQARMMIHIMKRLSIDVESKVQIVLNRLSTHSTVSPGRIEEFLQRKIKGVIPEEDGLVSQSILHGNPVVMDKRFGAFGQELHNLITTLELGIRRAEEYKESGSRRSMIDNIRSLIFERKDNYGRRA